MRIAAIASVAAAALAGCGALDNPDLTQGVVSGRLAVQDPAKAYVYVLGRPDVKAPVGADGSFRLEHVPAGVQELVAFDGSTGARRLGVQVVGADVRDVSDLGRLPAAGWVLASSSPISGTTAAGLEFTAVGTVLEHVPASTSGTAWLFPLPAGGYRVRASQPGFLDHEVEVSVAEGQGTGYDAELDVDDKSSAPGCRSCDCEHGLYCASDGHCYECTDSSQCPSGGTCTSDHRCSGASGSTLACGACSTAADCATGPGNAAPACVGGGGMMMSGYCSYACTSSDQCQAGQDCSSNVCEVQMSCLAYENTLGASCTSDSTCQQALHGGRCLGYTQTTPGYCSAACSAATQCPSSVFAGGCGTFGQLSGTYCLR